MVAVDGYLTLVAGVLVSALNWFKMEFLIMSDQAFVWGEYSRGNDLLRLLTVDIPAVYANLHRTHWHFVAYPTLVTSATLWLYAGSRFLGQSHTQIRHRLQMVYEALRHRTEAFVVSGYRCGVTVHDHVLVRHRYRLGVEVKRTAQVPRGKEFRPRRASGRLMWQQPNTRKACPR